MLDAHFHYVGANEEFDVTSKPRGVGIGMKGLFAVSNRVDLTLSGGVDNYFDASLHGHDTTYSCLSHAPQRAHGTATDRTRTVPR
jgi:hypothetical protein